MERLPLRFEIKQYRGKDEVKHYEFSRRLKLKEKLEKYITNKMDGKDYESFLIRNLASDLGMSLSEIEKILEYADYEGSTLHVCASDYKV